tara:strand:+ start:1445 stop:2545 length:1101 start_codon:yes stop_codon:yes gene_type:complete
MSNNWFEIKNINDFSSPCLVLYPNRIENNIKKMIEIAGNVNILRPHIKTHKIAEIIKMQQEHGISKFKCATISEADLLGSCNAEDILLAMQPTGRNIQRFFELIKKYPNSKFSTIADDKEIIVNINSYAVKENIIIHLWLDINNGMNRTGIIPNEEAAYLYTYMNSLSNIKPKGLHVYDGHIRHTDFEDRKIECDKQFKFILDLKNKIEGNGIIIDTIIAGGTPSFPIHVKRNNIEVSPGTPLLWDFRYSSAFKDLKFQHAAVLIGNIISKPGPNLICINLGHKSVAAEMDFPRVKFLNISLNKQISHSEEHLIIYCEESNKYAVGDICYAIPTHICPTVPKYNKVFTVNSGFITEDWKVVARDHS